MQNLSMRQKAPPARNDTATVRQGCRRRFPAVMSALLLSVALTSPCAAQYVLDRNLQQGSGGINPRQSDLAAEMRFRNAVVTGNAPGGLSFRGDVGYRAAGEFTGRLGADDTFSFRRDTVYSGLGGMGLRGTDSLQYQFALTTGMRPPPGFAGTPSAVTRTGTGSTSGIIRGEPQGIDLEAAYTDVPPRWSPGDTGADVRGLSMSAMRTPSAFTTTRMFQPTVLGITEGADGVPQGVTASVLRGVTYGPVTTRRDLEREGDVVPTPAELAGLRPPSTEEPRDRRLDLSVDTSRRTPYEELLERLRGTAEEREDPAGITRLPGELRDPGELREGRWQSRLMDLRLQLEEPLAADRGRLSGRIDPRAGAEDPELEERLRERRRFNPEAIEMLRRAGQIDVLAPEGFDAYAVHMESAQEHLRAGRFFDAEDRFTAALSARPGDPMAAIGRVHAELGAGMFLSAAINLRDLLLANPELTGARYNAELLPSADRMRGAKERLAELVDARPAQARENGMLLAYLGYQTLDPEAIERGLHAMEALPPEGQRASAADEQMMRLAALLRSVWTAAPEEPSK